MKCKKEKGVDTERGEGVRREWRTRRRVLEIEREMGGLRLRTGNIKIERKKEIKEREREIRKKEKGVETERLGEGVRKEWRTRRKVLRHRDTKEGELGRGKREVKREGGMQATTMTTERRTEKIFTRRQNLRSANFSTTWSWCIQ